MARSSFGDVVQAAGKSDSARSFRDPSIGKHTATVASADVMPLKSDPNRARIRMRFVVDSGAEVGASTFNSQELRPWEAINVRIFAGMAVALGIDPATELGAFDMGDPEEDTPEVLGEKLRAVLDYVAEKAKGARVQINVQQQTGREGVEAKYVNPLPDDAPPSQLDQAKTGAANMAAAIGKPAKPAGPKKPTRPAI